MTVSKERSLAGLSDSHELNAAGVYSPVVTLDYTTRVQTVGLGHCALATRHVGTKGTADSIARLPTDYTSQSEALRVVFQQQILIYIL